MEPPCSEATYCSAIAAEDEGLSLASPTYEKIPRLGLIADEDFWYLATPRRG